MKTTLPLIDCGKYILRPIERKDYLDYFEICSDEETMRYETYLFKSEIEALSTIEKEILPRPSKGMPVGYALVEKKTNKMIGVINFHTYYENINTCEIGFLLNKNYWNKHIMTKILGVILNVGFNYLGLDKILCCHVKENEGCKHVLLNNKFTFESKIHNGFRNPDGTNSDIYYYGIYRFEYERNDKYDY